MNDDVDLDDSAAWASVAAPPGFLDISNKRVQLFLATSRQPTETTRENFRRAQSADVIVVGPESATN